MSSKSFVLRARREEVDHLLELRPFRIFAGQFVEKRSLDIRFFLQLDNLSFFMLLDCRNTDITNPHRYLPPKCKVKSKSMLLFYQSNIILYFER